MTTVSPDTSGSESSTTDTTDTDTGVPACPYTAVDGTPAVGLQLVANGFVKPVLAVGDPQTPDRLFVADQSGFIKILEPGMTSAPDDTFLELDSTGAGNSFVGSETGVLGFALHPDFPSDPRVYVAYNPAIGNNPPVRISEFQLMDGDPNHADPASERVVIEVAKPGADNHNGGMIAFGPDGYLYAGFGDGGNGGDQPQQTGRNPGVLLAKIIRIDPNPDGTPDPQYGCGNVGCSNPANEDFDYTIPSDNPFVGDDNYAPEIWAMGLRNPWRFSFDLADGSLWVGDVGQNEREEVDLVVAGGDYGWSDMEGFACFGGADCEVLDEPNGVNGDGITMPVVDYIRGQCGSVVAGGVYRSCEVPAWDGLYLYGDFCIRELYAFVWRGGALEDFGSILPVDYSILGNGWNAWGDVYFTMVDGVYGGPSQDGLIFRVAPM